MMDQKENFKVQLTGKGFGFMTGCLLIGLSITGPQTLSARQPAGHTVTIRIIRPIQFSVDPVENRFQADPSRRNAEARLNWKSDSKPKKVTVSRKSDDLGSTLNLALSDEKHQKSQSGMRLEAVDENLTGAITKTAGSLTLRFDSGSKSGGLSEDSNERILYTVLDT